MQVPPEQPIGPGGYPRPPGYGTPDTFPADKIMGIILIILAALGACGSLALVGLGGLVGGAGISAGGAQGAGAVAAAGGGVMVMGVILLAICVVEIFAATWMMKSLRKGFLIIVILGGLGLILNIVTMTSSHTTNFFGIGSGLIFPIYSALRLFGALGPKPLD